MQVLGHTEYSTTARYLHQDQDKMKNDILEAIKKANKFWLFVFSYGAP